MRKIIVNTSRLGTIVNGSIVGPVPPYNSILVGDYLYFNMCPNLSKVDFTLL